MAPEPLSPGWRLPLPAGKSGANNSLVLSAAASRIRIEVADGQFSAFQFSSVGYGLVSISPTGREPETTAGCPA